jgi:N-acetyl-gamma-glutamyl-phosphate reductase
MQMSVKTAVVGGSGYAGGELLRLLLAHPQISIGSIMAGSNAGSPVTSIHQQLQPLADRTFDTTDPSLLDGHDLVFIALPHGESASLASAIDSSVTVVDLGADFRLTRAEDWAAFYGGEYAGSWVYGLTEINRALIKGATRISNPGCYATAIELGLAPLVSDGLIDTADIVVVAASGTSGAGRSAKVNLLGSEVMGSMTAYKVGGVHQHTPEIEQLLSSLTDKPVKISFTPLLAPMPRGIIATITAVSEASEEDLRASLAAAYSDEPFVHLLPAGIQPSTASTLGSNTVLLQVVKDVRSKRAVVTVALDNLIKGAAGQALQNANVALGLEQTLGLSISGVAP